MTDRERLLDELRPASFAIAYRMLGSVSEAEDVVQEALLRVHQALDGGEQIASPRAFVATVTTRLAINELRSARVRRERYVGEWLPEPIVSRFAVACDAGVAGEPLARAASRAAASRRVRLRVSGDRGDRRQERG
jgi:RNA polymerase sigma factor (sigma-70 family)